MNISIASDRGGENTEELIALDENRDAYHNALKLFIRGFMALPTDDKTGKAAEVYQLLKQHGLAMDRESYSVQSNLTTSLLNELAKPEMVSIISDLNLTDLITQYTGSEETFKSKYRESISAEASKEKLVAASSIKKEVHQLQKQTIGYLNAMLVAQPEKYKDVAAVVAEIMEKINQKIRNRYNKN
ncbi:DUF6261 family protein [Labilibacter marinus]|uniref:DUF6261 family protein n=1 Tax=Labilibacter marinus TaxID=1477105 RepID=UPI00117A5394|nr:DUF6261 family protein [Labilibacter marinus]